eukprot:1089726-Alexandrium_andersonii.AAC.1
MPERLGGGERVGVPDPSPEKPQPRPRYRQFPARSYGGARADPQGGQRTWTPFGLAMAPTRVSQLR